MVVGDLNADYNETVVLTPEHNNTGGLTGINDVLGSQGDEVRAAGDRSGQLHYDLDYELPRAARRSAYHQGFGWSTLEHMIVGGNLYDQQGITYVDNSYQIVTAVMPHATMLFDSNGFTNRWHERRVDSHYTEHSVGGFSDHLPIFARFQIRTAQSPAPISLYKPGQPDVGGP